MILLIILFLILLNIYIKKKNINYDLFPFIVVLMILYAGLKFEYSVDYNNYLINFQEINSIQDVLNTSFEKGYATLLFIFKILGLGFHSFLLFIAYLSIKMKSEIIKKYSVLPEISLLLYFLLFYLFNDVEQIRHGISIGFCFYSLKFLLNDDLKSQLLSILCIVLGILFHTSAVLFLFVYVLKDKFLDKKVYIILFILSIVLSFVNYFDVIAAINDSLIHSAYLSTKLNSYQHQSQSIFSLTIAIKIAMLSIFYLFAFDVKNKMHRLLFNIYYLGIVCTCAFSSIPILIARGSLYMRYTELLIIPIYISSIKDKSNKKIHYCILALIFIYYFMKFFISVLDPIYFNYSSI